MYQQSHPISRWLYWVRDSDVQVATSAQGRSQLVRMRGRPPRVAGSTAGQGEGEATSAASLSLSELIGALSYALDLTEGQPPGHCLRCCWIGVHTGGQLGLEANDLWDLYYALLLKDAGCSSNAARLYELYGTDDRTTKCDFKVVDSQSILQITRFVMGHAGVGRGLGERLGRILNLAAHGEALTQELITTRCERGGDIARQLGFGEGVAKAIRCLDEHWNGKGRPGGSLHSARLADRATGPGRRCVPRGGRPRARVR